jgi:hypothetical protein
MLVLVRIAKQLKIAENKVKQRNLSIKAWGASTAWK